MGLHSISILLCRSPMIPRWILYDSIEFYDIWCQIFMNYLIISRAKPREFAFLWCQRFGADLYLHVPKHDRTGKSFMGSKRVGS